MERQVIDRETKIPGFVNALKWNDACYHLARTCNSAFAQLEKR